MLTEEGYEVKSIVDGLEILSDSHILESDLILLDMMIPHLYESSDLINLYKDVSTPIIVMSSIDKEDGEYFANKINAIAFIEKPINYTELLVRVNTLLSIDTQESMKNKSRA
jgi:DNA-binding response OmpR family regulator